MIDPVAITGMGIVSAIGMNTEQNRKSLLEGRHGLSKIEFCPTKLKDKIRVGEIKMPLEKLLQQIDEKSAHSLFSRTTTLGTIALKEALSHAEIPHNRYDNLGFINATTVGGMDQIERYYSQLSGNSSKLPLVEIQDAGRNTELIGEKLEIGGYTTTISTACSSSSNAIMLGIRMIQAGKLDCVVVGGMDALSKFTINGFNTLMILSDEYNSPFDDNRKGLNLGEGAAYLVLESKQSYQKRRKQPIAYIHGYANANDAFHQTASSENGVGATLAMEKALKVGKKNPLDIDYINVHGTATPNNDLSEGRAMLNVFNDKVPPFSSTKPFTGHTLAAAGAIEAIFSILSIQEKCIFPTLNFATKMKEFDLIPVTEQHSVSISTVLSNSFGFGGNCSSLILVAP